MPHRRSRQARRGTVGQPRRQRADVLSAPGWPARDDALSRGHRVEAANDDRSKVGIGPIALFGDDGTQQAVDVCADATHGVTAHIAWVGGECGGVERDITAHAPMIAAVTFLELPDEQQPEVVAVGRSGRTAVIQLIFRTGAIRLLSLVGTTILARILLPEDFGTFAVVTLLINLVGPIADFGLGPALIQQAERPTQKQISTVFFLQITIATALMVLVWIASPLIAGLVSGSSLDLEAMIRVAAIVLPMAAIRSLPAAMMARVLRFGPLATIEVLQTLVYFVTAIVLALNGYGAWSFVWALIGNFLSGTILAHVAWEGRVTFEFDRVDARRIIKFGIPFQATGLLISSREAMVPLVRRTCRRSGGDRVPQLRLSPRPPRGQRRRGHRPRRLSCVQPPPDRC